MMNFLKKIKALFTKSDVEKTSLQKTARISIIFAAIALVGVIVYFAAIAPLLNLKNNYVPELFEGEIYQYSSIYILPEYQREQIKSVEIKNSLDHYKLNAYKLENKSISFQLDGSEDIALDEQAVSALLADVRVLVTNYIPGQERVTTTATEADLANYGLDEASNPAWFEVVLNDGNSYRVYVGRALATSSGFYARLEGRKNVVTDENGNTTEYDIVYALQSSLSETVLSSSNTIISKNLAPYAGNNIFSTNEFSLTRFVNGERKLIVHIGLVKDMSTSSNASSFEMIFPNAYMVNEDFYSDKVLMNLAYITASEIVAYGDKVHDPEIYKAFGMDLDNERLEATKDENYAFILYNYANPEDKDYKDQSIILYFSEKKKDLDETEYYYVYSPVYEVIGKIPAETFEFVDWQLAKFTSPYLFHEYLTNTEIIDIWSNIKGLETGYRFELSGKERSTHANVLKHGTNEIVYTESANGEKIPLVYQTKYRIVGNTGIEYYGEFENFRSLFYVLLTREFDLYEDFDKENLRPQADPIASVSITTSSKDHPITYYKYDEYGQREGKPLRDQGGNILCTNVVVPSAIPGNDPIIYEYAFYDPEKGRFFIKTNDPKDGHDKPLGFENSGKDTVQVTTYLSDAAYGEYVETIYHYNFYYLEYVDENGGTPQLNSTRMYVIPTITKNVYKLTSGGQKELLEDKSKVEKAEEGVYIRTTTINKLFSDTNKLLNGEPIDEKGVN